MSATLAGLTVVVTRPAAQANPFIERVQAAGADCIACPTVQIESLPLDRATARQLHERRWDWALFTSANAVTAVFEQSSPPLAANHAALGHATARVLERHGVSVQAIPDDASSEGVLGLREFADLTGRGVLLVKGMGGRGMLRDGLRARGAEVLELNVYRRLPVGPTAATRNRLHAALLAGVPLIVIVTSVEIAKSLLDHVANDDAAALRRRTLLVPGPRVAAAVAALGWTGPILQAASAVDDSMFDALSRLAQRLALRPPPTA